jgi:hypothetical protein
MTKPILAIAGVVSDKLSRSPIDISRIGFAQPKKATSYSRASLADDSQL